MAYHYLMKYVGTYRVLPELDLQTHDVPRNRKGEVVDGYDDLYIPCRCGAKIYYYGQAGNKTVILSAYFPKKTTIYSGIKKIKSLHLVVSILEKEIKTQHLVFTHKIWTKSHKF